MLILVLLFNCHLINCFCCSFLSTEKRKKKREFWSFFPHFFPIKVSPMISLFLVTIMYYFLYQVIICQNTKCLYYLNVKSTGFPKDIFFFSFFKHQVSSQISVKTTPSPVQFWFTNNKTRVIHRDYIINGLLLHWD